MLYNLMYYFKIKKEFVLKDYIANYINDSISAKAKMLSSIEHLSLIEDAVNIIVNAYKNGNKVYKIPAPVFLYLMGYVESLDYNK